MERWVKSFFQILSGFSLINLLRSLIPFVLLPILTSKLSVSEFGILSIFESTILILTPLLMFNAQAFLSTRYYKSTNEQVAKINANALGLAIIIIFLVEIGFFACSEIFQNLFGLPDYFLLWIPLFVLCRIFNTYIGNIWQIRHEVLTYGVFSIGTLVLDLVLSLLLVVALGQGYEGRLIGSHAALFIFSTFGAYLLHRKGLLGTRLGKAEIGEIIRFGLPLLPHALGGVSLALANRYLIGKFLGSGAVGVYSVAYQVASVMLLAGTSINQAWSVYLFRLLSDGAVRNRQAIRRLMLSMFALLVICCFVLFVTRDFLFAILTTTAFDESKIHFNLLLLSFFFQSVYFLFVNFDFYEERSGSIGVTTLFAALINIVLNLLLIPFFGLQGATFAALGSMGFYLILVISRVVTFNINFRQVWWS